MAGCSAISIRWEEIKEEEFQKMLENSPSWRDLEKVCASIPVARGTRLIDRRPSKNAPKTLFYYYESANIGVTRDIIERHFRHTWTTDYDSSSIPDIYVYKKDRVRVVLSYGHHGENSYNISCTMLPETPL